MKNAARGKFEAGVSLFWSIALFALLGLILLTALAGFANERNLFAEWWGQAKAQWARHTGGVAEVAGARAAKPGAGSAVRKCVVNGVVTYSNVECGISSAPKSGPPGKSAAPDK